MKKRNIYRFLYAVAALLAVGFAIRLGADYFIYNRTVNSAPFYAYVLWRCAQFLLPCAVILLVAGFLKRHRP